MCHIRCAYIANWHDMQLSIAICAVSLRCAYIANWHDMQPMYHVAILDCGAHTLQIDMICS